MDRAVVNGMCMLAPKVVPAIFVLDLIQALVFWKGLNGSGVFQYAVVLKLYGEQLNYTN